MGEMKDQFNSELKKAAFDFERRIDTLTRQLESSKADYAALEEEKQKMMEEWRDSTATL